MTVKKWNISGKKNSKIYSDKKQKNNSNRIQENKIKKISPEKNKIKEKEKISLNQISSTTLDAYYERKVNSDITFVHNNIVVCLAVCPFQVYCFYYFKSSKKMKRE